MEAISIMALCETCTSLAGVLSELLSKEREYLITFNTEALLENNLQKEDKLAELKSRRAELKARLASENHELTPTQKREWESAWSGLKDEAELNQRFLKSSMRNMDLLSENLQRLLGLHTLYTPKGTRTEVKSSGKVVEGRY